MPAGSVITFGAPQYLPLLAIPGVLLLLWLRQAWRRRGDVAALRHRRLMPVRERIPFLGELLFWLCLLAALALTIAAAARPQTASSIVRTAGVDFVVLQDGSASMHVTDVGGAAPSGRSRGNRWHRSVRFLRTLGESLRWEDDRVALALFAHIATPQVRLTRDPNTYFFFLDHLETQPPFRLEDDTSWDTNIERGIYWGLRLFEKDEELQGKSDQLQGVHPHLRRPGVERRGGQVDRARPGPRHSHPRGGRRDDGWRDHSRPEAGRDPGRGQVRPGSRFAVGHRDRRRRTLLRAGIGTRIATSPTRSST